MGWLLLLTGSVVFALAAFLGGPWDFVSWGFDSASAPAALIAAFGGVAAVAGLTLLEGRPLFPVMLVTAVGIAAVVLAADLFARDAGGWILGGPMAGRGARVIHRSSSCLPGRSSSKGCSSPASRSRPGGGTFNG